MEGKDPEEALGTAAEDSNPETRDKLLVEWPDSDEGLMTAVEVG